jgi:hypothetical protein
MTEVLSRGSSDAVRMVAQVLQESTAQMEAFLLAHRNGATAPANILCMQRAILVDEILGMLPADAAEAVGEDDRGPTLGELLARDVRAFMAQLDTTSRELVDAVESLVAPAAADGTVTVQQCQRALQNLVWRLVELPHFLRAVCDEADSVARENPTLSAIEWALDIGGAAGNVQYDTAGALAAAAQWRFINGPDSQASGGSTPQLPAPDAAL